MHSPVPDVSIIMSVYNREFSLVKRALDSVMVQDFVNFELIVIDDGSEALLSRQILHYVSLYENQITYIRHKNRGQAFSANRGVLNSIAPYIGLIDSDDEYKPNHISSCIKAIDGYDLIASTTENIAASEDDLLVPCKDNPEKLAFIDDCIVFGSLFGKREVFENTKFRNVLALDPDFYERASRKYGTAKLDLRTYKYYLGTPGSIMTMAKQQRLKAGLLSGPGKQNL